MKNLMKTLLVGIGLTTATATTAQPKSDTFTTPGGKSVTFHHIKHASIHIEVDGCHLYIDPVADKVQPKTDYTTMAKADVILITHEHADHYDADALRQLWQPSTAFYANKSVAEKEGKGTAMSNGDSLTTAKGIKIWAVPAYNTTAGRERFHPKDRDNGYVLDIDGLRVYVAGDTEDIPEMARLKDIDIAFLPCNQPYTMTVEQLERAAKVIRPKVLFPYHYSSTPVEQVKERLVGTPIDVRIRSYQ